MGSKWQDAAGKIRRAGSPVKLLPQSQVCLKPKRERSLENISYRAHRPAPQASLSMTYFSVPTEGFG
jgi:hypothetical protein